MIVSTKLIVSVDHVADGSHHPFDRLHGADAISISVHDSDWRVRDVVDGDISSGAVLFALEVRFSVLLEASLDAHLEEMIESACRVGLLMPGDFLITPVAGQVSADVRLELLPVVSV